MDDDYKKEKRQIKRRNYIQRDLRDLRGPFSTKVMPNKKTEPYRRENYKDYNIDNEDE
jgi:hypothetical protein